MLLPSLAVVMAWSGSARADLTIKIFEAGDTPYVVSSNSGSVAIDPASALLSAAAPDYTFTAFSATSNAPVAGVPGTVTSIGNVANLTGTGTPSTLFILVSDDTFTNPATTTLTSSSGYTSLSVASTLTFQSWATAGANLFGMGPSTTFSDFGSLGLSGSDNPPPVSFVNAGDYTITQEYVYSSSFATENLQPHGSSIVAGASVPEPSSMVLLGLGSLGLALIHRHRRRA
jgi:hypothetical protein